MNTYVLKRDHANLSAEIPSQSTQYIDKGVSGDVLLCYLKDLFMMYPCKLQLKPTIANQFKTISPTIELPNVDSWDDGYMDVGVTSPEYYCVKLLPSAMGHVNEKQTGG